MWRSCFGSIRTRPSARSRCRATLAVLPPNPVQNCNRDQDEAFAIADEIGISRSALYYYFASKEDILASLVEDITVFSGQRMSELAPRDKALVVYCRSGHRSGQAAGVLKGAGFTAVHDLGPMNRW